MKMLKSGGQDPKELYDMACSLLQAAEGLKEVAYAMGYDEESDMEKVSDEDQSENEQEYLDDNSHFVDQPTEGFTTRGERDEEDQAEAESDSEDSSEGREEEDSPKMPLGRRAILISLKKKLR